MSDLEAFEAEAHQKLNSLEESLAEIRVLVGQICEELEAKGLVVQTQD